MKEKSGNWRRETPTDKPIRAAKPLCLVLALAFFLLAPACARLPFCTRAPGSEEHALDRAEAQSMLAALERRNLALETFKGIGKIRLRDRDSSRTARIAWIGSVSGKLRVEVLDVTGRPVASIANDGQWFYFLSRTERRFHRRRATNGSLKSIIPIPIGSDDLVALLSGRVPIIEHHSLSGAKEGSAYVLTLMTRWGTIRERIHIREDRTGADKVEIFDMIGSLLYQAEIGRVRETEGFRIPFRLDLSDEEENRIQLDVSRYWANVPVSPSNFVLSPIR